MSSVLSKIEEGDEIPYYGGPMRVLEIYNPTFRDDDAARLEHEASGHKKKVKLWELEEGYKFNQGEQDG